MHDHFRSTNVITIDQLHAVNAGVHAPPPDLAAAPPQQPAHPKADPMSFPPGLIPQLVSEKLKTDPPYSPLSPLDIEKAGLPPTSEPDSYLQSRLDRFYAELQVCILEQKRQQQSQLSAPTLCVMHTKHYPAAAWTLLSCSLFVGVCVAGLQNWSATDRWCTVGFAKKLLASSCRGIASLCLAMCAD